ncbi:MAG: hypothetical protein WC819_06745, partial [Parcubacteria group bacterium]
MKIVKYIRCVIWMLVVFVSLGLENNAQADENIIGDWSSYDNNPVLATDPITSEPYIAFDNRIFKYSEIDGWQQVGGDVEIWNGMYSTDVYMNNPLIAFDPTSNDVYVAYDLYDSINSTRIPTVKKLNGSSWQSVGLGFFGAETYVSSFAFNSSDHEPYLVYFDNDGAFNLAKFNGITWQLVGTIVGYGISSYNFQQAYYGYQGGSSLAFDPTTGEPYVAFADSLNNNEITVIKFNGTSWELVGNVGFISGDGFAYPTVLKFETATSEPYVAYRDKIMKYSGAVWQDVVNIPEEHGTVIIDPDSGDFYEAYSHNIMKYSGGSWQTVVTLGQLGSYDDGHISALVFGSMGKIYISYTEGYSGQIHVMEYVDVPVVISPSLPTQTPSPTSITDTTATGNGTITETGGEDPERLIHWGTESGNYTDSCSAGTGGVGDYSCTLTNLTPGTTYYV